MEVLKNFPKRLKIYIKTATACKNYVNLSKQGKTCSKNDKKAAHSRWFNLNAGVDALFKEYLGMTQALKIMKEDRAIGGDQIDGLLRKIDNTTFLGTLYMLKLVLPQLSTLSKTFQKGSLNFSRISLSIEKTIRKMHFIEVEGQHFNTLMLDIGLATQYVDALEQNIQDRFCTEIIHVLKVFHIFDGGMVPEEKSEKFEVFGNNVVQIFKNHYYKDNIEKTGGFENQWDDFKCEMVRLKKKWISFKSQLMNKKIELKSTSIEWSLKQTVKKGC